MPGASTPTISTGEPAILTRAAEHTAIAAELALPEPIVEHGNPFVPRLIVARQQTSAERDFHTQQAEETIADARPAHFARLAGVEHRVDAARESLDLLECSRLLPHAHEIGWREEYGVPSG